MRRECFDVPLVTLPQERLPRRLPERQDRDGHDAHGAHAGWRGEYGPAARVAGPHEEQYVTG